MEETAVIDLKQFIAGAINQQTVDLRQSLQQLVLNRKKIDKDWTRKIVLPEARQAFQARYQFLCEQAGDLPTRFL